MNEQYRNLINGLSNEIDNLQNLDVDNSVKIDIEEILLNYWVPNY
jgi:hypothetical protein